ncbi:MAG: sigma-54-dependent Fis family transcriptional regulator [Chitinispirillaceae bacterium]|nr:sigma-54-dependent Fis family transcriptional regulator [Chitinispirillaceae bacterium]
MAVRYAPRIILMEAPFSSSGCPGGKLKRILIVDDDTHQRKLIVKILSEEGYNVTDAESVDAALAVLSNGGIDLVLTDLKMPGKSGLDLLAAVDFDQVQHPEIIVMTAFGNVDTAVKAMKMGAYDYLTKPVEHDELLLVVRRAVEKYHLRTSVRQLGDCLQQQARQGIVAESEEMRSIITTAEKVAMSDATILVRGESGTGKERIAQLIHYISARKDRPIQCINCAAFPDTLLESELFGYERGAFTGAITRKEGILEAADGSTVFLDEVADMSLPLQAKLLRVIQEKEIRRLGATATVPIDVRFIAATNKNLEECVRKETFREDLFYRLNIIPIALPPLRQRRRDIVPLIDLFLLRRGKKKSIEPPALQCLQTYAWPGNVRELEAVIERLLVLSSGDTITVNDLPAEIGSPAGNRAAAIDLPSGGIVFEAWEQALLEQALQRSNGVMADAAKLLGMTYRTFQYRAEKFGLTKNSPDNG